MRPTHAARAARNLCMIATIGALAAVAGAQGQGRGGSVRLIGPFEIVSSGSLSDSLAHKIADLAAIDPVRPLAAEQATQTLSMFGREDLIAATSGAYAASHCAPAAGSSGVWEAIEEGARATSIVIINESHERSEHRGFVAEAARRLRPLGYATLAIETLSPPAPGTPAQYMPSYIKQTSLPYFMDGDGFYPSEAGFGRLGRQAKALGYRLLPYEFDHGAVRPGMTPEQRLAIREEQQAHNLAAYMRDHPGAKILVHVGYSHAAEVPRADGARWMAARLKAESGIDPLTVSQTTCRGGGEAVRLSALPAKQPPGTFDLLVDHPTARFVRGRPEWRSRSGDRAVPIPKALWPAKGWRVVEARPLDEPATSVPMDRVAIRPGEDIALMLPPGRYRLRVIDASGAATPSKGAAR